MSDPTRRPLFLVFEGLDGCGKTTVSQAVAKRLGAIHLTTPSPPVREYREGLLEALGECQEARQLFYLATVFAASREIEAHLAQGQSVVLDRYFLSTQAYAEVRGSELRIDEVQASLLPADLTFLLEAPLEVRLARTRARGVESVADRETMAPEMDVALCRAHLERAGLPVLGRFVRVDVSESAPDAVVETILAEVGRW